MLFRSVCVPEALDHLGPSGDLLYLINGKGMALAFCAACRVVTVIDVKKDNMYHYTDGGLRNVWLGLPRGALMSKP